MNTKQSDMKTKRLRKMLTLSLLASVPLTLTGCGDAVPEDWSAYEECQYEMESTGVMLDCEDEDSDWYKSKGYYKSKKVKSSYYKSSRSGYGSGYSSGG